MIELLQRFKQHKLREVKSSYIPTSWLFFDSETKEKIVDGEAVQMFHLGWTCYWRRYPNGRKDVQQWKYWNSETKLCQYFHTLVMGAGQVNILGHNIFFDLQACGFFLYFNRMGWMLDFIYDKGLTYILRCKRDKRIFTALSTTNWFDQSLKDLGQLVGLRKLEANFLTITDKDLGIYCRRDVEILVKAMKYYLAFIAARDLGKFCMTKSSQAYTAYRHRFMSHKIILHDEPSVTCLERKAYFGGRTECFQLGQISGGPFITLDINSNYSFVSQSNQYPWKLVEFNRHMEVDYLKYILKTHCVIAEVTVDTPEPVFAVRYNKKTVFPIGRFKCTLCTTGLKYALEHEYIKDISSMAVYRKADLFSGYVDYFHPLLKKYEKEDNKIMRKLCKYYENSLYGKFAQKSIIRDEYEETTGRDYFKEDTIVLATGELITELKLLNKIVIIHDQEENPDSFPGLAAHITENARFLLWDIIKEIGRDRVLYCDTDSVKIRESDLGRLKRSVNATELGALKIEDRSEQLYIGGSKYYITEKGRHIKGIPLSAKEVEPGVYEYLVFRSQDKHLRKGMIKGVEIITARRHVETAYDKGVVGEDGHITPFVF